MVFYLPFPSLEERKQIRIPREQLVRDVDGLEEDERAAGSSENVMHVRNDVSRLMDKMSAQAGDEIERKSRPWYSTSSFRDG